MPFGDGPVTLVSDALLVLRAPKWRLIIDRGWRINTQERRTFSHVDFPEYSGPHAFRTAIYRINKKYHSKAIVLLYVSGVGYYAIKGSGIESRTVTPHPMVGTPHELTLVETLLVLGEQVRGVHDIDLLFQCPPLYEALPLVPQPVNLDKTPSQLFFPLGRRAQLVAHHTGTASVRVKCSSNPFPRDNLTELLIILEEVWQKITANYVEDANIVPPPRDWVVKVWHCNQDGREISGPDVEMTFSDFSGVLYRFYRKGPNRYRLETIENVGRSIRQLVEESLRVGRTDNDGSEAEGVVE